MRIIYLMLVVVLLGAGCSKHEEQNEAASVNQERVEMAKKLMMKSMVDLQNKDLKSAIESLEKSIEVNPTSPDAYLLLGQILLQVNEYQHAAEFLDNTAKIFPNNGSVYYMLSIANRMNGQKLPAVLSARRAVEIFQQENDKDNMLKSAVLLQDLVNTPDDKFAAEAKKQTNTQ